MEEEGEASRDDAVEQYMSGRQCAEANFAGCCVVLLCCASLVLWALAKEELTEPSMRFARAHLHQLHVALSGVVADALGSRWLSCS